MKNIFIIIKKELRRFFTDKRILVSLILPGVLIFVIYSLMGEFMSKIDEVEGDYVYEVVIVNYDNDLDPYFVYLNDDTFNIKYLTIEDDDNFEKLRKEEIDLYVIYPNNFYSDVINFDVLNDGRNNSPIVKVFYNSGKKESRNIYLIYDSLLTTFKDSISEKFRVNFDSSITYDLVTEETATIMIITSLVPFLLVIFLFTGAMGVSIEAIAGEKERGTIATLLATPMKREELALGKIISLSIITMTSAASSFLGLMLSLPKLMMGMDFNLSIYGFGHYSLLFLVIVTTTLLYVVLISLVSAFSKSVKEASSLATVVMVVNMLVGITSMGGMSSLKYGNYIPIYNSVMSISNILSLKINALDLLITSLVNLGVVSLGVYLLTLMFNSEKIMFNK